MSFFYINIRTSLTPSMGQISEIDRTIPSQCQSSTKFEPVRHSFLHIFLKEKYKMVMQKTKVLHNFKFQPFYITIKHM